jgi:hypothetical protein
MTVKLHRCPNTWVKLSGHPCWRVQKALDDQGISYEVVRGPWRPKNRTPRSVGQLSPFATPRNLVWP